MYNTGNMCVVGPRPSSMVAQMQVLVLGAKHAVIPKKFMRIQPPTIYAVLLSCAHNASKQVSILETFCETWRSSYLILISGW